MKLRKKNILKTYNLKNQETEKKNLVNQFSLFVDCVNYSFDSYRSEYSCGLILVWLSLEVWVYWCLTISNFSL